MSHISCCFLDLTTRKLLDECGRHECSEKVTVTATPPDGYGLRHLAREEAGCGGPMLATTESMNGAHFIHDTFELMGLVVEIADVREVKGTVLLNRSVATSRG